MDLAAKQMENSNYSQEQFWKLVVRHENDIVNFDEEKSKMVQKEIEMIEEINTLKAELTARGIILLLWS